MSDRVVNPVAPRPRPATYPGGGFMPANVGGGGRPAIVSDHLRRADQSADDASERRSRSHSLPRTAFPLEARGPIRATRLAGASPCAARDDEATRVVAPRSTAMSMYVRVKRAKTTMFLHVEPTETVMELKQKIQTATDSDETPGGIPIDRQRLLTGPTWEIPLEDARQLQELKVENDAVLALVYATEDGEWEPVAIERPGGGAAEPPAA